VALEGKEAVIRLRDSGIGIAAEQLPRLFDMFTQVDTSLERSRDGLGIGLALVKKLVELHGGSVEAGSAGLGRGSEFIIRLPISLEASKPVAGETVVESKPTVGRRILIVDDNKDGARSLAMLLKLAGHQTDMAHDGIKALEAAERLRPDAVLLDIGLPKLNGYEVCRRIREQPWGKDLVMIAVSGWGQEEDLHKSRDAGFNNHMVKPVDHEMLTKMIDSLASCGHPD
jgi:CheY-like chemotaxis protein